MESRLLAICVIWELLSLACMMLLPLLPALLGPLQEGFELLDRLEGMLSGRPDAAPLPMFTSCCPVRHTAWSTHQWL